MAAYRRHYIEDGGMFDTELYAGVLTLLGNSPRTVTARRRHQQARTTRHRIVRHLGLAGYFETVGGDTLDGERDSKALVIGEVLGRLGGPDPATSSWSATAATTCSAPPRTASPVSACSGVTAPPMN